MNRSHVWQPFLGAYRDLRAVQFAAKADFQAATKLLWSGEFPRPPFDLVGYETIIVPAEAVSYFREQGLNFTETAVLSAGDLPAEKINKLRREQGF